MKLTTLQKRQITALMLIDSLMDDGLEQYLGEDIQDDMISTGFDKNFELDKLFIVRQIINENQLSKPVLLHRPRQTLTDYINAVKLNGKKT